MHCCRHSLLKVTLDFRNKTWLCHAKNSKLLKEISFRCLKTNTLSVYNIQENAWQKFSLKLSLVLTDFHISPGDQVNPEKFYIPLKQFFFFVANIKQ